MSATSPPEVTGDWDTYLWMVVCGGLASCFMAWGIGANDAANSFATSVGSKTLTLWQAVIICAIFEFLGAMVLGGEVAKTVASKIADVSLYEEFPEMYMYGMLCALTIAGLWLLLATMWCLPVSTTHSITGAIMGFALVFGGWNGVIWFKEKGDFPFCSGFTPIVLSWFFSPIIGGILAAIFFNFCRFFILRRQNSTKLAIYFIPFLIFFTFFICLMFVLAKGAQTQMQERWPCYKDTGYKGISYKNCSASYQAAAWIAAVVAAGVAVISGAIAIPLLLRKIRREGEAAEAAAIEPPSAEGEAAVDVEKMAAAAGEEDPNELGSKSTQQRYESIKKYEIPEDASILSTPMHYSKKLGNMIHRQVIKGLFYDVHMGAEHNAVVARMHEGAEVFKPETEKIFSYLQVISAACVAFAHGSNDVANAIGPFSAIYTVFQTYEVPGSSTETAKWIFAMGGGFIVIGLATYGYNIIMTIGVQLLKLTPSRGFAAELAAGMTIALASFFGIPVSTTQIIVGAETGVGLSESLRHGLNFMLLLRTFLGWIWTILLALALTAALFAMGAYAPSIPMSQQISDCQGYLYAQTSAILTGYIQPTNLQFENDAAWWSGDVTPQNGSALNQSVVETQESFDSMYSDDGQRQLMFLDQVTYYYEYAVNLNNTYARTTIGQAPQPPVTVETPAP